MADRKLGGLELEELLLMAREGVPPETIAEELTISIPLVYQKMKEHNIIHDLRAERDSRVIAAYQTHTPIFDVLDKCEISQYTLYRILHKHQVPLRRGTPTPARVEEEQLICRLYQTENRTLSAIKRQTNRSISFIYAILRKNEIPLRSEAAPWRTA